MLFDLQDTPLMHHHVNIESSKSSSNADKVCMNCKSRTAYTLNMIISNQEIDTGSSCVPTHGSCAQGIIIAKHRTGSRNVIINAPFCPFQADVAAGNAGMVIGLLQEEGVDA